MREIVDDMVVDRDEANQVANPGVRLGLRLIQTEPSDDQPRQLHGRKDG